MQDIAETYRASSNDDLIRVHADIANLTPEAKQALLTELDRRGLADTQVTAQEQQWQQEAAEEQKAEQEKRKKRPIRWLKILGQFGVALAFVAVYFMLDDIIHAARSAEYHEAAGSMAASGFVLTLGISVAIAPGKIRVTLITGAVIFGILTVVLLR